MDFVDPSTQMSDLVRAIRMAQEELDSVVMQQEYKRKHSRRTCSWPRSNGT